MRERLEILKELVKSMLSMVTPRLAGIGRPSFCQVIVMGRSPEPTTHGMKTRCPMENLGNSKGWIKGGTERKGGKVIEYYLNYYLKYANELCKYSMLFPVNLLHDIAHHIFNYCNTPTYYLISSSKPDAENSGY